MSTLEELQTEYPVMPGRKFLLHYGSKEGTIYDAQGSFWKVASGACIGIIDHLSTEGFSKKTERLFGNGPYLTFLEDKSGDGTSFTELDKPASWTDKENANRAYYQGAPGAAWLLLEAGLTTERELGLTMREIREYVKNTQLLKQNIGGDEYDGPRSDE